MQFDLPWCGDHHRTVDAQWGRNVNHDRRLARSCNRDRPLNLKQIERQVFVVENSYAIVGYIWRAWDHHRTAPGRRRGLISVSGENRTAGVLSRRTTIDARSWLFKRQFGSHDATKENRSHDPINPLPQPHQTAQIFGPKSFLKPMYSLVCSSTFDWFMKQLSKFGAKS